METSIIKKRIIEPFRAALRKSKREEDISRLRNLSPSILSSNCVGGVICHELGLPFMSPTINLYMEPADFVRFLEQPRHYLSLEMTQGADAEEGYPVGKLDDIAIHFVHYASFEEGRDKWIERASRLDFDNLYVMMCERDGCTVEDIERFDRLPYANKVVFTASPMPNVQTAVCLPDTAENGQVRDLCSHISPLSGLRHIDKFDYVEFLNRGH